MLAAAEANGGELVGSSTNAASAHCAGHACTEHCLEQPEIRTEHFKLYGAACQGRQWADLGPTLGQLWADFWPALGRLLGRLLTDFSRLLADFWADFGPAFDRLLADF